MVIIIFLSYILKQLSFLLIVPNFIVVSTPFHMTMTVSNEKVSNLFTRRVSATFIFALQPIRAVVSSALYEVTEEYFFCHTSLSFS